jgi:chromosome partitioning protein
MYSVAFLNGKGGVGKTTLATQIAVRACDNFERVCLIDLDPSGGARTWFKDREGNEAGDAPTLMVGVSDPVDALERAELDGYEFAVLDGSPGTIDATRVAVNAVGAVVIPEKTSHHDMAKASLVAKLCADAKTPAIGVINEVPMKSERRPYQKEMAELIADSIREYGLPVVTITDREQFLRAMNAGIGVHEMSGRGMTDPQAEIDALYEQIVIALGIVKAG